MTHRLLPVSLLALFLGCGAGIGPHRIPPGRFSYNLAIVNSQKEQMLLNLVRLRYQDTPLFLDLENVVATFGISTGLKVTPGYSKLGTDITRSLSAEAEVIGWEDRPTITYTPLQGDEFAKRLLAPIQPQQLLLLIQSGWGLERLMVCCVQQVNDLPNATSIGGLAPVRVRQYDKFQRVAILLRQLQEEGHIQLSPAQADATRIVLGPGPVRADAEALKDLSEAANLLGLKEHAGRYLMVSGKETRGMDEIEIRGRSLLGVMAFLAQTVEVPPDHQARKLVRQPLGPEGGPFDWGLVSRGMFKIHSGEKAPSGAYVKIPYRGHWYWINDDDLESKSTFALLSQLFSLQAATSKGNAPILTLPGR